MVEFEIGFGHAASQCQIKELGLSNEHVCQEKGKPQKDEEHIQTP